VKSNKNKKSGLVYSTDPENVVDWKTLLSVEPETLSSQKTSNDRVRISISKKHRAGKEATLIEGLTCDEEKLKTMAKDLKTKCGVGGSVVDGAILLQGKVVEKAIEYLIKNGYKDVKKSGG